MRCGRRGTGGARSDRARSCRCRGSSRRAATARRASSCTPARGAEGPASRPPADRSVDPRAPGWGIRDRSTDRASWGRVSRGVGKALARGGEEGEGLG
uniref:Uncharacterized protein n=1 Tax=Arundo donax TaxID=35708 RepID=A0A0A9DQV9_ARUDO